MTNDRGDAHRYDDIIDLPHHVSAVHPPMPLLDRAAQFAPFRALTGYEDEVAETARLTEERVELDEERIAQLDRRLRLLDEHRAEAPEVTVVHFVPDARKAGGSYQSVTGRFRKLDALRRVLVLRDGREIAIGDIYGVEGALFAQEDRP